MGNVTMAVVLVLASCGGDETMGAMGTDGLPGPKGDTGSQGAEGSTGPQGSIGSNGPAGPQGLIGPRGAVGTQGDIGPQGLTGSQGPIGPQGSIGLQGTAGSQGSMGAQGVAGLQGAQGMPFLFNAYLTAPTGDLGTGGTTLTVNLGTHVAETVRFEVIILGQITSSISYYSPDAAGQLQCAPVHTWVNICEAAAHFPSGNQQLVFTVDTSGTTGTQTITRAAASAWAIVID